MTSRETLFSKNFTEKQIRWLAHNPPPRKALTDAEAVYNAASSLYSAGQYENNEQERKLSDLIAKELPSLTLAEFAHAADANRFKDETDSEGNKVSGARKFYDAYFGGEKDKTERDTWRRRIKDNFGDNGWEIAKKVLQNTANNAMMADIEKGRQEILEGNADGQGVTDWGASALWGLFAPRSKKAVKEGRKVGASEILGDVASDILYGIPAANIAKPFQVAAGRLPGVAANILSKGASMGAQFAAPGAIYGVDKALGNETDWRDPLLGGLANMGVNKAIGPMLGRGLAIAGGKISQRLPGPLREALEGTVSPKMRARNTVSDARRTLLDIQYPEKEAHAAFEEGKLSGDMKRFSDAARVLDIANLAKTKEAQRAVANYIAGAENIGKIARKEGNIGAMARTPEMQVADMAATVYGDKPARNRERYLEVIKAHPELMTLFAKEKGPGLGDVAMAFGVNKYGGDKTGANYAAQALSFGALDPKEIRKEQEKERRKKATSVEAASILAPMSKDSALSEEDRKWLGKIADNPDIVRGMAEGSSQAFRNWYLLRGQDLLRNTQYFRATPEVEDVWKK